MKFMPKEIQTDSRQYRLGKRQAAIDENRAKIIEAARELILSEQALQGFSIDAVAKQAGVARMTVYNQFGGRRGLLEALFDDIGLRGGMFDASKFARKDDPLKELDAFIKTFGSFWQSERLILRRLHAMNRLDEEMGQADAERQERRRIALRALVGRLQKKSKPEFSFDETVEILQTLTSFESFDLLAGEKKTPIEVVPIIQKVAREVLKMRGSGQ
ncbi:MAG TPA: TetR/AcrR family transcriptional regulator [Pyrinomonadaceae bacterium]|jgi:AcrR family transcriptional regulator|nr:TetR/AcrR family transcriptional regulator [Pyrinomonadaceae bacterium]